MLMRDIRYQVDDTYLDEQEDIEPRTAVTPREMLLGQFVLILWLAIAILMRSIA